MIKIKCVLRREGSPMTPRSGAMSRDLGTTARDSSTDLREAEGVNALGGQCEYFLLKFGCQHSAPTAVCEGASTDSGPVGCT